MSATGDPPPSGRLSGALPGRQSGPPSAPRFRTDRLVALFLLALVAFNPPLLRVFGAGDTLFGLPLLYLYALGVWAMVIALAAVLLERGGRG